MGRLRDRLAGPGRADEGEDPDYRFSLANERTFLAWIRTSLALLAAGVALVQFLPAAGVPALRTVLGLILVLLGTGLAALSHRRWRRTERAMRLRQRLPGSGPIALLATGMTVIAIGALVLVVLVVR